jgi:hypothetical protein
LESFLNKHQDVNYFYGNNKFSGVPIGKYTDPPAIAKTEGGMNAETILKVQEKFEESVDELIDRQNIQLIHQNLVQPVFLRNALPILSEIGQGGSNMYNALINQPGQQNPFSISSISPLQDTNTRLAFPTILPFEGGA